MTCSAECGFTNWNNPTPVVAALVRLGSDFVLARNAKWPEGLFSVISGYLESGESPEVAIARETHEELGLSAKGVTFLGHYPFLQSNQIIIAYMVDASGEICSGSEISEVMLLTKDELATFDFGPLELTTSIVRNGLELHKALNGEA
jgi:NADH pyrophosphatase NudC (nudix superfamily)